MILGDTRGVITGHFITHWGPPSAIRPRMVRAIGQLAVLEFAPNRTRTYWRYATNGMSQLLQPHEDSSVHVRTELYAATKEQATWVDDLLIGLATYPFDYSTYLSDGDTIDVGQPVDQRCSPYTGVLLVDPIDERPSLGLVAGLTENVLIHQVIGLFGEEVCYAEAHGSRVLREALINDEEILLDIVRTPFRTG